MSWPAPDPATRDTANYDPTDRLLSWHWMWGAYAEAEGWSLFECAGRDHEPVELEACSDAEHYAWVVDPEMPNCDDEGAWRHVITGALAGNELHQATLMVLHAVSPGEFAFITRHTLGGAYA